MISIEKRLEQRIIHYQELEEFQRIENFDFKTRLIEFVALYTNSRNVKNRVILNFLHQDKNQLKKLIEINESRKKFRYEKNDDEKKTKEKYNNTNNEKNDDEIENDNENKNENENDDDDVIIDFCERLNSSIKREYIIIMHYQTIFENKHINIFQFTKLFN